MTINLHKLPEFLSNHDNKSSAQNLQPPISGVCPAFLRPCGGDLVSVESWDSTGRWKDILKTCLCMHRSRLKPVLLLKCSFLRASDARLVQFDLLEFADERPLLMLTLGMPKACKTSVEGLSGVAFDVVAGGRRLHCYTMCAMSVSSQKL